jgi:hypothetical protein
MDNPDPSGGMRYVALSDSRFKYDQISEELHCFVSCDKDTTPEDIEFKILPHRLLLKIKGEERLNDFFTEKADCDGTFWELDYECGGNWALHITIAKREAKNWSFLFKSEMFEDAMKEVAAMEEKQKRGNAPWCDCSWLFNMFGGEAEDAKAEKSA